MAEKALAIEYSSLAPTTEIRILTLKHGKGDDPIACSLRPAARDGAEYHALSYEREDESKNDPFITVDNRQVQIRMNLFEALKNIRKPTEDLRLWVDAICINQSDVQEKSQQVAMMGEIFTEAAGVISWLGPARDDSDLAMYAMRFNETPDSDSRELKALLSFCHRRYWRRVWIIQELYLTKSYVVWCGHKSVSDSQWERSLASLNSAYDTYGDDFTQSPANQHSMARLFRSSEINTLHRWLSVCKLADF